MCNTQRNKMKELNTFKKFLNEGEEINEASGDYVKELAMELVQYYDRPVNMLEAILNVMSDGDAEKYLIMLMKENGIKIPKKELNENEDDGYDKASRELFDMTWDEVRRENDPRMRQAVHDEVQKDDDTDYIDDVQ